MNRIGICSVVLVSLALQACSGVLSYSRNDTVFAGALAENDLNRLNRSNRISDKGSANDMEYALDRGGTLVGVCRTEFHDPNGPGSADDTPGDFDLEVFDILGQRRARETQSSLLRKVDNFAGTKLQDAVQNDPVRFMHCYRMGASSRNDRLVLYLQPQNFEESDNDFAVEFRVLNQSFSITDFEIFAKGSSPSRVVARDNPLNGHTVAVTGGVIRIDGADVTENGNPVNADSVKHRFP